MYSVIRLSPSRSRRIAAAIRRCVGRQSGAIGRRITATVALSTAVVDRLPSWSWPLLVAVAGWPSVSWALRRLFDASEDALGIVALCALVLAVWQSRRRFGRPPRAALLVPAALLVVCANLPLPGMPDPVRALIMTAALVLALAAIAEHDEPIAPYAGLALLALPLLSSLQSHAGFPLRVVTAEASRWLLAAIGEDALRTGADLTVGGRQVLVDGSDDALPLAWVGFFTACLAGWMFSVSNRAFSARLPAVGVTVLVVDVVRKTLLVAADAGRVEMTDAMHAAVGLGTCATVVAVVGVMFADARTRRAGVSDDHDHPSAAAATRPLRDCRP